MEIPPDLSWRGGDWKSYKWRRLDTVVTYERKKRRGTKGETESGSSRIEGKFLEFYDMGRAKLPPKRIEDEKKRNRTFKKRREGLKKKMHEFATLCGVKASMICFGPEGDRPEVVLWPEGPGRAEEVFHEYRSRGAEERGRRNWDLSSYMMAQVKKAEEELLQWRKANASIAYPEWDSSLNQSSEDDLLQVLDYLNRKIKIVENHIERAKEMQIVKTGQTSETLSGVLQGEHHENRAYFFNMEKSLKLDYELEPIPISYMEPPVYPEIRYPSMGFDSSSIPNLPTFNYFNNEHGFSNPQQRNPCYSAPGYNMLETEDYLSDMDSFSGNHGFLPLMGDSSSSNQMLCQPEFSAGMQHSASAIQSPAIQLGDLLWQFPT